MEQRILEGPWRHREGVTQAVIPPSDLLDTGVCHVRLSATELAEYSLGPMGGKYCGAAVMWLYRAEHDGEIDLGDRALPMTQRNFPHGRFRNPYMRRIDWEQNYWHYDTPPLNERPGLTDETNYNIQDTIGPAERANRKGPQHFLFTLPFPVDWQGPTVTVPWAGEYAGKAVQAPLGYATIFDLQACWHRGDRWLGSRRGLLMQRLMLTPAAISGQRGGAAEALWDKAA